MVENIKSGCSADLHQMQPPTHTYPFTAPAIIPDFWNLCKNKYNKMIGIITSVVPARITGHGVDSPSLTGRREIVTISVYFDDFLKYKRGQKKSFHLAIRVIAAQDAKAGLITGSTIFVKIPKSVQPSTRAASISSSGISLMY